MPMLLGPDGQPIPFSQFYHRKEFDAVDGALPSWLQAVDGAGAALTPTFSDSATGRPGMTIATASATSGLTAGLTTAFSMHALTCAAAKITVEGFTVAQPTAAINMGIFDGATVSRGARVQDAASSLTNMSTVAQFRRFGPSTGRDVDIDYQILSRLEYNRRRNLSFLLLPPSKEMYLMENDQVFGYRRDADMVLTSSGSSALKPWIRLTSSTAAVVSFRLERLVVEWWT